jgi:hypothetical protein
MTTMRAVTARMLQEMLTANTGRHFLDSGGVYGRHWERNQGRDFAVEAPATVNFRVYARDGEARPEIEVTANIYHWLLDRLAYDPPMDRYFRRWVEITESAEGEFGSYLEDIEAFLDHLKSLGCDVSGLFDEGEPTGDNSYNGECILSQTIQYTYANVESPRDVDPCDPPQDWDDLDANALRAGLLDGTYVFLQIHGGCDVRGGYTRPTVFVPYDAAAIFLYADASLVCTGGHGWHTDDAYHWYPDADYSHKGGVPSAGREAWQRRQAQQLENMAAVALDAGWQERFDAWRAARRTQLPELGSLPLTLRGGRAICDHEAHIAERRRLEGMTLPEYVVTVAFPDAWVLPIDTDGAGYCPVCGAPLSAIT